MQFCNIIFFIYYVIVKMFIDDTLETFLLASVSEDDVI